MRIPGPYLFVIALLLSCTMFGQRAHFTVLSNNKEQADSLRKALLTASAEQKLKIYKALYFNYANTDLDTAALYINEGINLSKSLGDKRWQVDFLRFKSHLYGHFLYYGYSEELYNESVNLAKKIGYEEGLAWGYDRIGNQYYNLVYKKYLGQGEAEMAKRIGISTYYFKKASEIFKRLGNNEGIGYTMCHLSWSYLLSGHYDSALAPALEGLKARLIIGDKRLIAVSYDNIAQAYKGFKNYPLAIKYFDTAIALAKASKSYINVAEMNTRLADLYLTAGNFDSAKHAAYLSYSVSKENNFGWEIVKSTDILAKAYENLKQYDNALMYKEIYLGVRDSLVQVEESRNVKKQEIEYAYNKQKQKADQKQAAIGISLVGLFILITSIAIISFYSRQKLDKANKFLLQTQLTSEEQRKKIETQAEKLEEMNNMKNKLFSIVSHDIRNPLALTTTYLSLLKNKNITEAEFKAMVPEISNHLNNTSSLLTNLLMWAKGQMSGSMINKTSFDIAGLLDENIRFAASFAKSKSIQLTVFLTPGILVYADKVLIDIVCRNLLTNAIKFSRKGDSIIVKNEKNGDWVNVEISDTGVGIPTEKIHLIFSENSYSEAGTANETGWGLGLILCKEFVEKNGGKIGFESEPGKGARFYFSLPATVTA